MAGNPQLQQNSSSEAMAAAKAKSKLRPQAKEFVFRASAPAWTPTSFTAPPVSNISVPLAAPPAVVPSPPRTTPAAPLSKSSLKFTAKEFVPSFLRTTPAPVVESAAKETAEKSPQKPTEQVATPPQEQQKQTSSPQKAEEPKPHNAEEPESEAKTLVAPETTPKQDEEEEVATATQEEEEMVATEIVFGTVTADATESIKAEAAAASKQPLEEPTIAIPKQEVKHEEPAKVEEATKEDVAAEKEPTPASPSPQKETHEEPASATKSDEEEASLPAFYMYTIAQLLEMEPTVCPMPEEILKTVVVCRQGSSNDNNHNRNSHKDGGNSGGGGGGRGFGRSDSNRSFRGGRGGRGGGRGNMHRNQSSQELVDYEPIQSNDETRWKPSHAKSKLDINAPDNEPNEVHLKEAKSLLNKLSLEKFDKLSQKLIDVAVKNEEVLTGVIELLVDKAQMEWHFASMYAELCSQIATSALMPKAAGEDTLVGGTDDDSSSPTGGAQAPSKLFRKILLSKCQKEFEVAPSKEGFDLLSDEERMEKELILKRRTLGHIRFIGELFKKRMLRSRIMHECILRLFGNAHAVATKKQQLLSGEADAEAKEEPLEPLDEENLECLCNLMTTIGKTLEHDAPPQEVQMIGQYYGLMETLSNPRMGLLSTRLRFLLRDLLDLRQNKWVARRKETKAMTIAQVHAEIEKEEKAKAKAAAAANSGHGNRFVRSHSSGQLNHHGPPASSPGGHSAGGLRRSHSSVSVNHMGSSSPSPSPSNGGWKNRAGTPPLSTPAKTDDGWETAGNATSGRPRLFKSKSSVSNLPPRSMPAANSTRNRRSNSNGASNGIAPSPSRGGGDRRERKKSPTRPPMSPILAAKEPANTGSPPPALPQLSKEKFERKLKGMLEEFADTNDLAEACQYLEELQCAAMHDQIAAYYLNSGLERSAKERSAIGKLLSGLFEKELVDAKSIQDASRDLLEFAEDMEIDIPLTLNYLGEMMALSVVKGALELRQLTKELASLPLSAAKRSKFVVLLLEEVTKQASEQVLRELYSQSGLAATAQEDDVLRAFADKHQLA